MEGQKRAILRARRKGEFDPLSVQARDDGLKIT
jgi:hypothetical protein